MTHCEDHFHMHFTSMNKYRFLCIEISKKKVVNFHVEHLQTSLDMDSKKVQNLKNEKFKLQVKCQSY